MQGTAVQHEDSTIVINCPQHSPIDTYLHSHPPHPQFQSFPFLPLGKGETLD